jgi:hypothetical protein
MTIISFKHNFIFVKTLKTAGTSIEIELSKCLEDDEQAIITPIYPSVQGHRPRNFEPEKFPLRFFNHMPALIIRRFIGEKTFNNMFKFCVEREPVAKCLSDFHMRRTLSAHTGISWEQYCDERRFPIDLAKYTEFRSGARVKIVDTILAYETLAKSLPQIADKLQLRGFKFEATAKSEYSKNRIVAYEEVTQSQRKIIYAYFAPSLAISGLYSLPI